MEVGCDTLQQERGAEEVRTEDGERGRYGAFVHLKRCGEKRHVSKMRRRRERWATVPAQASGLLVEQPMFALNLIRLTDFLLTCWIML